MDDPFRDAEPGKILHELRLGEMTAFEERPHSPYYGSADATPLFLILLEEYERWTGDRALVRSLEHAARAAIEWIDEHGDRDGDGYVEYERRNLETGLDNQCWKDSWDSIVFADGTLAETPRATCEIQGYVYDAKCRTARLARSVWNDAAWAEQLEHEAETLKRRFNEDYWIADRGFFALALDKSKRQVDSLTSNIGHLLWSGIADPDKAERCVEHLMSEALFRAGGCAPWPRPKGRTTPSGTMSAPSGRTTTRSSRGACAAMATTRRPRGSPQAILDAAEYFNHRLPEAFAGYPREHDALSRRIPHGMQPAGVGHRGTALAGAHDARARLRWPPPDHRSSRTSRDREARSPRHPRLLGKDGRIRPRQEARRMNRPREPWDAIARVRVALPATQRNIAASLGSDAKPAHLDLAAEVLVNEEQPARALERQMRERVPDRRGAELHGGNAPNPRTWGARSRPRWRTGSWRSPRRPRPCPRTCDRPGSSARRQYRRTRDSRDRRRSARTCSGPPIQHERQHLLVLPRASCFAAFASLARTFSRSSAVTSLPSWMAVSTILSSFLPSDSTR